MNGAIAVAALAAASHGAGDRSPALLEIAARLQLFHALLLLVLSLATRVWATRLIDVAGLLATIGCLCFSGGLYVEASRAGLGWLVPIGGTAFILAWLAVALAALRAR